MPPVPPIPVNYSNLGDVRFGRFFWVIALFLISSQAHVRAAQSVRLAWNASPTSGVTGYRVHYRTSSGSQSTSVNVGNVLTATISNLNDATTYWFSVSAYNGSGLESTRSNEISYTTPSAPPQTYLLTVINGTGGGPYPVGREVTVTADPAAAGEEFDDWEGDIAILDDFTSETTQALIIARDVTITATYSALPTFDVVVTNGTGDGSYYAGAQVNIYADPAPAGQQFAGWSGNVTFANASSPTTSFTMPSSPVVVTATYSTIAAGDVIRYFPREGYNSRMIGGVFEGTNGDPVSGPYTIVHTISGNPPLNWTSVNVSLGSYRYLRYRGANNSYGNVAEIEFYRAGVKLTGTGFGSPGSWNNSGNTFSKALDGVTGTFFDGPVGDGNYLGIDTDGSGPQGSGLRAQYYNDSPSGAYPLSNPFAGTPVLTRTDATVDFDWDDSPAPQVNSNFSSARWTGQVKAPVSGSYTFTVTGDDGVRLFINGTRVINSWETKARRLFIYDDFECSIVVQHRAALL